MLVDGENGTWGLTTVCSVCLVNVLIWHHDPVGPVDHVENQERQREQAKKYGINTGHTLTAIYLVQILQSLFYLWRWMDFAVFTVNNV